MKQAKAVVYNVECVHNTSHIFEKTFNIEEGSENTQTKVETFCPFCEKQVMVRVHGKVLPDEDLLRKFNL